jgi:hypothetical protein
MPAYTDPNKTTPYIRPENPTDAIADLGQQIGNIFFGTLFTHNRVVDGVIGANLVDGLYAIADAISDLAVAIDGHD